MSGPSELAKAIAAQIASWARLGHPCPMERFVLKHGRDMEPEADHPYEMGTPKECFTNSGELALMGITDLTYVEGYAVRPKLSILIHHAWLMDTDGRAVDVTWTDTADCLYFGVPVERKVLRDEIGITGFWGVLDSGRGVNIDFMQRFDPEFEIPEIERSLNPLTA